MDWFDRLLTASYFFGLIASFIYAARGYLDFKRRRQWFRLLDIPAFGSLALVLFLILIATGASPRFSGDGLRIAIRLSLISWASFSVIYGACYVWTYITVEIPAARRKRLEATEKPALDERDYG